MSDDGASEPRDVQVVDADRSEPATRSGRVYELFHEALGLSDEGRTAFLSSACDDDPGLRDEVAGLLRAHARGARDAFDELMPGSLDQARPGSVEEPSLVGSRIGPYVIRGFIASGGMGRVFQAARVDDYEQVVAIKLLRPELFTSELRERFRTERQALARLAHPNVARLLDGGTTPEGLPYLVMEHIPGRPIDRYCDEEQLPVVARMRLFEAVCRAVGHAHGEGILHRDLKPANILVTADGTPKLTDFGLAKVIEADSAQTVSGQILGTPGYMAPEQATGDLRHATVAADVYALGAVLYVLLTGRPPFKGATWRETLEQVRAREPVPPRRLLPGLARDPETICLKCLRKDPRRRYANADALTLDVGRFLEGRPIVARRVGLPERLYRWGRRHRLVAALGAGLIATLVGGLVGVTCLWRLAESRGDAAMRARDDADHHRRLADDRYKQARDTVDRVRELAYRKEMATPGIEPLRNDLFHLVHASYERWGEEFPDDLAVQRESAKSLFREAKLLRESENYEAVLSVGARAAKRLERLARDHPDSIPDLSVLAWHHSEVGLALGALGRHEERLRACENVLALRRRILRIDPTNPSGHRWIAWSYADLGECHRNLHRIDVTRDYWRRSCEEWRAACDSQPTNPWPRKMWARTCQNWGRLELDSGRPSEALRHFRESNEHNTRLNAMDPRDHDAVPSLAFGHVLLARALRAASEPEEARRAYARAVEFSEQVLVKETAAGDRFGESLSGYLAEISAFEREQSRPDLAVTAAIRRRTLWPARADEQYAVAREIALCIPLVARGKVGTVALAKDDDEERRRYSDLAIAALRSALQLGFDDWPSLAANHDLDPLRTRPDFPTPGFPREK